MASWVAWLVLAIASITLEIFTPAFYFASIAVGALTASLAAYFTDSLPVQLTAMAGGALASFVFARQFFSKMDPEVRTNLDSLIGTVAVLTEDLDNGKKTGRVSVSGDSWRVKSNDGNTYKAGEEVRILKVQGNTLYTD